MEIGTNRVLCSLFQGATLGTLNVPFASFELAPNVNPKPRTMNRYDTKRFI